MIEAKPRPYMPRRRTRRAIVVATLTFCVGIINFTTIWGDPANSLHTSAQAWAFSLAAAVISGYIFGAVWDNQNVLRDGK